MRRAGDALTTGLQHIDHGAAASTARMARDAQAGRMIGHGLFF
jgi:hypothetical protein